ncbi:MAG: ribosome silencing factor [Tannerella sp.]|jgi:ribosome-associated protein|nr:ribosome silencing factor [Tannerella sp.]
MNQIQLLLDTIIKGLQEKKGRDIVTVDFREMSGAICQYMVICEGSNPNQISALSDSVWDMVNKELKEKPLSVDGLRNTQWVGMDYGTIIVHIFLPEIRAFYRLENLWEDSKITKIPDID